uniref:Sof1-like protein domain-containing protein n=1 Tax=Panagrolaimus davidi TaxID=227884 RepID=A0A914QDP1_9BILA
MTTMFTLLIREILNQLKWFTMIIQLQPRQNALHEYSERLRKQYQNHLQTGAIIKHRQAPKAIFHTVELKIIHDKKKRKEGNLRRHAKPGTLWV